MQKPNWSEILWKNHWCLRYIHLSNLKCRNITSVSGRTICPISKCFMNHFSGRGWTEVSATENLLFGNDKLYIRWFWIYGQFEHCNNRWPKNVFIPELEHVWRIVNLPLKINELLTFDRLNLVRKDNHLPHVYSLTCKWNPITVMVSLWF